MQRNDPSPSKNNKKQSRPDSIWLRDLARIISVDVETAGPNPSDYALLSIGACTLLKPRKEFYVELQPAKDTMEASSQAIHGMDFQQLKVNGKPPKAAMQQFSDWLRAGIPQEEKPLFMGFNAPFDWMFVCDYFHHYLGENPFGHAAMDIKSFYMGFGRVSWEETSMAAITTIPLRHNALEDARDQADLFLSILQDSSESATDP